MREMRMRPSGRPVWPRSAPANLTARRRAERRTAALLTARRDGGAAVRARPASVRDAELPAGVALPGDERVAELRAHLVLLVGGVDARDGISPEDDHRGVDDEQDAGDGEAGSESAGEGSHLRPSYPGYGVALSPVRVPPPAATTSHSSSIVAEARIASASAGGERDAAVADQAHEPRGRVDAEARPAPASSAITAAGPSQPASTTAARAAAPRRAVAGSRSQKCSAGITSTSR